MLQNFDPQCIYLAVIVSLWGKWAFQFILCLREQRMLIHVNQSIAPLVLDDFEIARLHGISMTIFYMVASTYRIILLTIVLHFGGLYKTWAFAKLVITFTGYCPDNWDLEYLQSLVFNVLVTTFFVVMFSLPSQLYFTFVLEERHGFNRKTFLCFMKGFVFKYYGQICFTSVLLASALLYLKHDTFWMFWGLAALPTTDAFMVPMGKVYKSPTTVGVRKLQPLTAGSLRDRLEALATHVGFPIENLVVQHTSTASAHTGAYFSGQRIVFRDTLLQHLEEEEIEAVLGHELGHWSHSFQQQLSQHLIQRVKGLISIWIFALLSPDLALYKAFGFPEDSEETPIFLGLFIVLQLLLPLFYEIVFNGMAKTLSRHHEYKADAVAVKLGLGEKLKQALFKLEEHNLIFPTSDPLFRTWFGTHPTGLERFEAINKLIERRNSDDGANMEVQKPFGNLVKFGVNFGVLIVTIGLFTLILKPE